MEKIGVEAIVQGLSSFLSGMGKMDNAISKLIPGTDMLSNAFGWLGDVISGFAGGALRVLEYTLGNLIADAIEAVISKVKELITNIIEAGNEFQTLSIRLDGLNLQTAIDSGLSYNQAIKESTKLTQEQLEWLQTLGAATPFDPAAIANVYTLARSYGFADQEARRLTKDTLEFSAGMGLSSEHLERVIQNLGQMVQRGKITSTEIRDLARGAFLPVNDVLERIVDNINKNPDLLDSFFTADTAGIDKAKQQLEEYDDQMAILIQRQSEFTDTTKESTKMGLANQIENLQKKINETTIKLQGLEQSALKPAVMTVADLQKEISKPGGGVPAQLFIDAFEQMVEEEPRFIGAAGRLGRAFIPATENVKELATSVFGLNVVKPVLDVLGEKVASMVDLFVNFNKQGDLVKTERWDALVKAATKLSEAITTVLSEILGLVPSTEGLADSLISGIERFAQLILSNKDQIVGFFRNVANTIVNKIIPFVGQLAQGFINWLSGGGGKSGLQAFFDLMSRIGSVITDHIVPFVENRLIPAWDRFSAWVYDNRHLINGFFRSLGEIFTKLVAQLTDQTVGKEGGLLKSVELFMRFVTQNEDLIIDLINAFIQLNIAVLEFKLAMAAMAYAVTAAFVGLYTIIKRYLELMFGDFLWWVNAILRLLGIASPSKVFIDIGKSIAEGMILGLQQSMSRMYNVGVNMINSIRDGVMNSIGSLIDSVKDAAESAYNAVLDTFGMNSPSTLFIDIGQNAMRSMAMGIQESASIAAGTMRAAAAQVSVAAAAGTITNNNNTNNMNNTLNINSNAPIEPIIQDFEMLNSLSGSF